MRKVVSAFAWALAVRVIRFEIKGCGWCKNSWIELKELVIESDELEFD